GRIRLRKMTPMAAIEFHRRHGDGTTEFAPRWLLQRRRPTPNGLVHLLTFQNCAVTLTIVSLGRGSPFTSPTTAAPRSQAASSAGFLTTRAPAPTGRWRAETRPRPV